MPKLKKDRNTLPFIDPVDKQLFKAFLNAAGSIAKCKQDLKSTQLKIAYTILCRT